MAASCPVNWRLFVPARWDPADDKAMPDVQARRCLIAGIGLRIAAAAGALIMAMMWAAELPLDRFTAAGEASGSTNPFMDYHLAYAMVLVVLALTYAGHTWGLGRIWARLPFVQKNRWMI